jgi:hypothetical protein
MHKNLLRNKKQNLIFDNMEEILFKSYAQSLYKNFRFTGLSHVKSFPSEQIISPTNKNLNNTIKYLHTEEKNTHIINM